MANVLSELEQDPFDPDEFVERLAWRTMGGVSRANPDNFDPTQVYNAFEKTIKDLKEMNVKIQRKVDELEIGCKDEEKLHWHRVADLQKHNQTAFGHFQELDERINYVATKVVHLGDQLEGVNTPRARAVEAQKLIRYFKEFMTQGGPQSEIFTDPFMLQLAADVIQKLYMIAQELPSDAKFDLARKSITGRYDQIENNLIEEFKLAHREGDRKKMRRTASILSNFKGYSQCIDVFVEESQKHAFSHPNVFDDIPPLCEKTNALIQEVFINPEMVMSKLVLNIYHGRLQSYLKDKLQNPQNLEQHLLQLNKLFIRTKQLSEKLSVYKMGNDTSFLTKLTKNIFAKYLESYISMELKFLNEKNANILNRYYDSKRHQKKQMSSGGIHEFRRDLQAVIGAKANLNLGPTIENYGGETFLSQEVAINLLQESKLAFKRCQVLSSPNELANNATHIFDILVQFLCVEHMDYALELGLQAIPLSDPRNEPEIYFYDVVGMANTVFHLFEKQFSDSLVPLVNATPKHSECLQKKREIMENMENKLDLGLDRTCGAMVGWVRFLLKSEQKISDFKPESEEELQMHSRACGKVVKYINKQVPTVRFGLDGKNVDAVFTELGIKFHRTVYDHLLQFQYTDMGAMLAICDVNEYRKCVKEFNIPLVCQLFENLHSLCNLLVVVPDNLKQVCKGEQLNGLDRTIIVSFVQLRADYKSARIFNIFR